MQRWRNFGVIVSVSALVAAMGVIVVPTAANAGVGRPRVAPAHRLMNYAEAQQGPAAPGGPPPTVIGVDNNPPPGKAANWEFIHYFPESGVTVAPGGVVLFQWNPGALNGLHSVTFLPNGMSVAQARSAMPVATSDTDNGEKDVVQPAVNNNPTRFDCSTPDNHTPCPFDGSSVLSSGVAPSPTGAVFAVQVAPATPPGDYTYICLIHRNMQGTLHVAAPGETPTDPATVAAKAKAEFDQLTATANQTAAAANRNFQATANADGTKTWTVHVGITADDVELLGFFPRNMPIRKGDTVHFTTDLTANEIHTVTFPNGDGGLGMFPFGPGQCEVSSGPDETAGAPPGGHGPPEFGCKDPNTFEQPFIVPAQNEQQVITSEKTLGSSGLLSIVPEFASNGALAAHDYKFTGNGTYYYQCLVHPGMAGVVTTQGYRVATANGGVYTFGNTDFAGSKAGAPLTSPVVATVATNDQQGYWLVTADGHTFNFGSAPNVGSVGIPLAHPIVAAATSPDDGGLFLASGDGGVFALGDATFQGSLGATHLNQPIVAMTADRFFSGGGYTLIAADGGTFTFGSKFLGSLASIHLVAPIVAAFQNAFGEGLTLIASDGGVFTLGNAIFMGSLGATRINAPIVAAAPTAAVQVGYRLLGADGGVYDFGPGAPFLGSVSGVPGSGTSVGIIGA